MEAKVLSNFHATLRWIGGLHEDLEYKSSSGNVFRFNTNPRLNDLLMKLNMKMGLFKSGQTVNVDFDHVFV